MKKFIILAFLIIQNVFSSKIDSLDAKVAKILLKPESVILDNKVIMQTNALNKAIGQKKLEMELSKQNKSIILVKTDLATPYSVIYDFYSAINKTNIKSTVQYTDEFNGYLFIPKSIPEPVCDFTIDSMHLAVIVGDTSALIRWGKYKLKEIVYEKNDLPKFELRQVFTEIAKDYRCSPDFQEIIIISTDNVPFKKILDVMYVSHTTFFQYISFGKLKKNNSDTVMYPAIEGYYDPNDTSILRTYSGELPAANKAYFEDVRKHFALLGRNVPKDELTEYTGSIMIASIPPVAEVHDQSGFIGFTNKSYLYFKPGMHTIRIQKGFKSNTRSIEITRGKNPSIFVRLSGSPSTINKTSVQIPAYWFDEDTYQLDVYGESVIDNFFERIRTYGSMDIVIVLVKCPENKNESFTRKIDDRHINVLEKALLQRGITSNQIKRRTDIINEGDCQEELYLVQEKSEEETPP